VKLIDQNTNQPNLKADLMLNSKSVYFRMIIKFLMGPVAEECACKQLGEDSETWSFIMCSSIFFKQWEMLSTTAPETLHEKPNLEKIFYSLKFSTSFQQHSRTLTHVLDNLLAARGTLPDEAADAKGGWYVHFIRQPSLAQLANAPDAPENFRKRFNGYRDTAHTLFSLTKHMQKPYPLNQNTKGEVTKKC
jgi:hypothetical protein